MLSSKSLILTSDMIYVHKQFQMLTTDLNIKFRFRYQNLTLDFDIEIIDFDVNIDDVGVKRLDYDVRISSYVSITYSSGLC